MKNTERDFEDLCYLLEKETRCEPSHENIPWTDVISACIDYKLTVTKFNDTQLNDVGQVRNNNTIQCLELKLLGGNYPS